MQDIRNFYIYFFEYFIKHNIKRIFIRKWRDNSTSNAFLEFFFSLFVFDLFVCFSLASSTCQQRLIPDTALFVEFCFWPKGIKNLKSSLWATVSECYARVCACGVANGEVGTHETRSRYHRRDGRAGKLTGRNGLDVAGVCDRRRWGRGKGLVVRRCVLGFNIYIINICMYVCMNVGKRWEPGDHEWWRRGWKNVNACPALNITSYY